MPVVVVLLIVFLLMFGFLIPRILKKQRNHNKD